MGITLKYPFSGTATATVSLPWPAHDQPVNTTENQTVYYTPSGDEYVVTHGPPRYQITRNFEMLSETEMNSLITFWLEVGRSSNEIAYQYTDKSSGTAKSVRCRIVGPIQQTRKMKNMWDAGVTFEHKTHPNQTADPAA